jgi:hypothetical protein
MLDCDRGKPCVRNIVSSGAGMMAEIAEDFPVPGSCFELTAMRRGAKVIAKIQGLG